MGRWRGSKSAFISTVHPRTRILSSHSPAQSWPLILFSFCSQGTRYDGWFWLGQDNKHEGKGWRRSKSSIHLISLFSKLLLCLFIFHELSTVRWTTWGMAKFQRQVMIYFRIWLLVVTWETIEHEKYGWLVTFFFYKIYWNDYSKQYIERKYWI